MVNTLQHTAKQCSTLRKTHYLISEEMKSNGWGFKARYPMGSTLQHTATHCNALQRIATHCNALQHTATHCNALQHTAAHYRTVQHTALHWQTDQTKTQTHWQADKHTYTHIHTHTHTLIPTHAHTHYLILEEMESTKRGFQARYPMVKRLQHTATHCNTLQHTTAHDTTLTHRHTRTHKYAHTWFVRKSIALNEDLRPDTRWSTQAVIHESTAALNSLRNILKSQVTRVVVRCSMLQCGDQHRP